MGGTDHAFTGGRVETLACASKCRDSREYKIALRKREALQHTILKLMEAQS